jgi:hypothetical protein
MSENDRYLDKSLSLKQISLVVLFDMTTRLFAFSQFLPRLGQ